MASSLRSSGGNQTIAEGPGPIDPVGTDHGGAGSQSDRDQPADFSTEGRSRSPRRGGVARAEYCARLEAELRSASGGSNPAGMQAADSPGEARQLHSRVEELLDQATCTSKASPSNWEQPPEVTDATQVAGRDVDPIPDLVDVVSLRDLLGLHDLGAKVLWPPGVDLLLARRWVYQ